MIKRSFIIFVLLLLAGSASADSTTLEGRIYLKTDFAHPAMIEGVRNQNFISELIGIYFRGTPEERELFINSQKYPYTIELQNGTGPIIRYIIPNSDLFPRHDVVADCPMGEYKIEKCWFVKYINNNCSGN